MSHNHKSCSCGGCSSHLHEHTHAHEHGHTHAHSHGGGVKETLFKLIPAGILFAVSLFFGESSAISRILCAAAYIIVGYEVIFDAVKELIRERSIGERFLMGIASAGAIAIGELREAAAVMIFYTVGELLEDVASERSRRSVTSLLELRPDSVNVIRNGETVSVSPEEVSVGEIIIVSAGERIALDGIIINGETEVDNSALTGESLPVSVPCGGKVYGGGINLSGTVEIKTEKVYAQSSGARILELVENSQARKAKTERFITRFARYYTLAVVSLAAAIIFICPLFTGYAETFTAWLYRGLILLVASCPCALVISVPLSFFAGVGCASRKGILIKGTGYIEQLAKTETVAFDKTGTLTKGRLKVDGVYGDPETLRLCALCESHSTHPIASAIVSRYGKEIKPDEASGISEKSGRGVSAVIDGRKICCGNRAMMRDTGVSVPADDAHGGKTCVYVADDNGLIGSITLSDEIRPESKEVLKNLGSLGVKTTAMLTGDNEAVAADAAREIGVGLYKSSLSPQDKVDELAKLIESTKNTTAYVGDGINDSPVIALADVGIAMGGLGSDAAIESADVVILEDKLSKIPLAVKISRKTVKIAKQNITFALAAKITVMALGLMDISGMWAAVFADVGVTVIAVLNSLRALYYKGD